MTESVIKEITYFSRPGKENTEKAIELAVRRAKEGDVKKLVVATSSGGTGENVIEAFKGTGVEVIPVVLNAGSKYAGGEEWKKSRENYEKAGIMYVQGIQAFSGVERAINKRWGTAGPVMVVSDALRLPGEGFKVAIEVVLMAADAGRVSPDEHVLAMAGTSKGSDTVLVVKPAYSHSFFDFAVREIVCKPLVDGVKHDAR